jgi:hypothetical protein
VRRARWSLHAAGRRRNTPPSSAGSSGRCTWLRGNCKGERTGNGDGDGTVRSATGCRLCRMCPGTMAGPSQPSTSYEPTPHHASPSGHAAAYKAVRAGREREKGGNQVKCGGRRPAEVSALTCGLSQFSWTARRRCRPLASCLGKHWTACVEKKARKSRTRIPPCKRLVLQAKASMQRVDTCLFEDATDALIGPSA